MALGGLAVKMVLQGELWWTGVPPRVYSCFALKVPRFHHDPYQEKVEDMHETQLKKKKKMAKNMIIWIFYNLSIKI